MKNIMLPFLIVFAGLIINGCSDPVSVNSDPVQANQGAKEVIKIPVDRSLSSEAVFSATEIIDGDKGGKIKMKKFYFSFGKEIVTVSADVKFPAGSFSGKEQITMEVNTDEASVTFTPHMVFQKDVIFNFSYAGINSAAVTGSPDFVFLDDNGSIENIKSDGVFASGFSGISTLLVKNAELKHFSRYAFVKDPENGGN
ncbi:MAG: hypothetical protein R6W90_14420 [Ignavibacteriaceae bacterium]